jgi:hypothetical protein
MIMNIRPAQPEEVELAMREMEIEKSDTSAEKQNRETSLLTRNSEKVWSTSNTSAYRAAYIKTHHLDL